MEVLAAARGYIVTQAARDAELWWWVLLLNRLLLKAKRGAECRLRHSKLSDSVDTPITIPNDRPANN